MRERPPRLKGSVTSSSFPSKGRRVKGRIAFGYAALLTGVILASMLGVPGFTSRPPVAEAFVCPAYSTQDQLRNDSGPCRQTFIVDPGVGAFIQRNEFLNPSVFNYYRAQGFTANFLWYAKAATIHVPYQNQSDPGVIAWASCANYPFNPLSGHLSLCPTPGSLGFPHINSTAGTSAFHNTGGVDLDVIQWPLGGVTNQSTFIGTVCGNFSVPRSGNPIPKITGTKFNDLNGNGVKDSGEPGLAGWTIQLHDPSGGVHSAVTDSGGNYTFALDGLGPGTYHLTEVAQSGWIQTHSPGPITVNVGIGDQVFPANDFGNYHYGSISGRKFQDINANGPDPSDPPVVGWPIQLSGHDGKGIAVGPLTVPTDGSGNYVFNNLPPGTYTLTEGSQPGWGQSWPVPVPPGRYDPVNLVSGQTATGLDFGNYLYATIQGRKYEDLNLDGSDDSGTDPGLENWVIHLDGTDGLGDLVNRTTMTNMSGDYLFDNVVPGDYTVTEELQPGWTPSEGTGGYPVHVESGDNITHIDFGNWRHATITAEKYDDLNGNGVRDAGEPGLDGWTIHLDGTDDLGAPAHLIQSTGPSGSTTFSNVVPGHYTLTEELQAGWVAIEPIGGSQPADPLSGDDVGPLEFGNYVPGIVSGTKVEDVNRNGARDPGEPGIPGWTITLSGTDGQGNPVSLSTVTDGSGNYQFSGLPPGMYEICEVNPDPVVWEETLPGPDGTCYSLTVHSHDVLNGNDFGNFNRTILWYKTPDSQNLFVTAGMQTYTFDEVLKNQLDPNGLGGFSFDVHYDPTVWQQPTIDLSPAVALFAAAGRTLDCSITIPQNGTVHVVCASTGTIGVGPEWPGPQVMAHVTLTPQDALVEAIRPNKENGDVSVVKDDQVTLTNTCGQPLNDGSIQPLPGQPECQGVNLVGVGPGGLLDGNPNGGQTVVTIRRLEGDVVPDCTVDVSDMQLEASKFGMSVGNLQYGIFYDVNAPLQHGDGEIDINDTQFVYGRFGSTCASPLPDQPPQPAP